MSLPGFPSVTPFILSQGEKGWCFNICLYLALPLSLHSSYGKVRRGGCFNICLYLALPLSFQLSYRKVRRGGGFNICLYLAFPLSFHLSDRKVRRGGVLTYVSTWLCFCHPIHLMAR